MSRRNLGLFSAIICMIGVQACQVYDESLLLGNAENELDAAVPRPDAQVGTPEAGAGDDGGEPSNLDAGMRQDAGDPKERDAGLDSSVDGGRVTDSGPPPPSDDCPDDPDKTAPGICGCGIPDTDGTGCTGLIDALTHRYRFDDSGSELVDSVGDADGTTTASQSGDGTLTFDGTDGHGTLPAGVLSALSAVTIEMWLTWNGGPQQQRALSFGTAVPTLPADHCAGNAHYHDGSWYHFCTDGQALWADARSLCEDAGGHLAAIESAEEQQHVVEHPDFTASFWFGANDIQDEGEWHFATSEGLSAGVHFWSGDENGSAVGGAYENWRRDEAQPDDSSPDVDCGFIYGGGNPKWGAFGCESNGAFICEWSGHQSNTLSRGVWFTPADGSGLPSLGYKAGSDTALAQASDPFPSGATHAALVLDPAGNQVSLYIDGVLAASATSSDPLAELRDADNWLGRSHITGLAGLDGQLSELRIYDRALSAQQLATSHDAGPDPAFLEP